ncbi:hypothetical protein [Microbacterium gorillae]|uniref:hypothetical protein n=1 Tax=Microbacterium gorillae TaxID=1231063 RepID=UPI00058E5B93|nr:hypothetical protein [Microbacterium gorillae]
MRGKIGLVVGLGVGYVLGTRAGRERYEQIAEAASKLWHTDPVQKQVANVKAIATTSALAVPKTLWSGAVKVVQAVTGDSGSSAAGQSTTRGASRTPAAKPTTTKRASSAKSSTAAKATEKD